VPVVRSSVLGLLLVAVAVPLAGCGNAATYGSGAESGSGGSAPAPTKAADPSQPAPTTPTAPPAPTTPTAPPAPSGSPGSGAVLRLGPADSGRRVTMAVGDRLVVFLSTNRFTNRWALLDYPRDALRLDLRGVPLGAFGFTARAAGSGAVALIRSGCGPGDRPCLGGASPVDPTPPVPGGAVTWTVTVVVR
jgi:hypothetical protein